MRALLILWLILFPLCHNQALALTMDQAVNEALQFNPRVQQGLELANAADARVDVARAPFWPRIDARYSVWRGERDSDYDSRELSMAEASAGLNLFNGGSDWFRLHEARHRAFAANYQRRSIVADIVLETKQAYIEVLRARRTLETETKSVELLEKQRHDTQLRLEQGLIARNDLLRVDVELATARQVQSAAEGRLEVAWQTLALALGRPLGKEEPLTDLSTVPVPPGTEEQLRQEMFAERSELKFLNSLLAAEVAGRKAIQGDLLPDVDLVLSYDRLGNKVLPETGDPDYDSESKAMLQASWVLFSGLDTHYELVGREHEIRARQSEVKATKDRLTLQLQTALEAYRVSERNLATAETAAIQAEENYRVNENRYRSNVATTVDLLDAQEFLTRARNEAVKARYDLYRSAAVVERVLERGPRQSEMIHREKQRTSQQ